jgi:ATP-dependent DNA ligase
MRRVPLSRLPRRRINRVGARNRAERTGEWQKLRPELVVEVRYDEVTAGRFRHGTTLLRWRPDKAPRQCRFDQLPQSGAGALALLDTSQSGADG